MPSLRVKGKLTNSEKVAATLKSTASSLDGVLREAVSDFGRNSVEVLRKYAPKGRSHALARGIKARRRGDLGVDLTVHAIAPESGYDYAAVTRFGHVSDWIFPTEGRRALKLGLQNGDTVYRANVRGFHPKGDWVDLALPELRSEAERVANEAGRAIEFRLFS